MEVDVHPANELRRRPRLFAALAELFEARFEPVDGATPRPWSRPLIAFAVHPDAPVPRAARSLLLVDSPSSPVGRNAVVFAGSRALDRRLRGRTLHEGSDVGASLAVEHGDEVLATAAGSPIWIRRAADGYVSDVVAQVPAELDGHEVLRDRLAPSRFLALLPIIHFLRDVCGTSGWRPPPPRAAFVVDDPNLHWPTYGPLSYASLVPHSREHGYHTSIAMVPLDAWYANRRAVGIFRESPDVLSLCVHGNDHRMHELGRLDTRAAARRVLAQALRRTISFERRTELPVSRVMVPPYEACSPATMAALLEVGFEAICVTRPCPWRPLGPSHSPFADLGSAPLSGWRTADLTEDGLPTLIRRQFDEHDDILLRAFLNQPVILYGHVADLAHGLDPLSKAADLVNSLAPTTWSSLADLSEKSFEHRRKGSTLEVRPFGRRIRLRVDPDVTEIRIEQWPGDGFSHGLQVDLGAREHDGAEPLIVLPPNRHTSVDVQLEWRPPRHVSPIDVPRPPLPLRVVARRAFVETRDRLRPVVPRLRSS